MVFILQNQVDFNIFIIDSVAFLMTIPISKPQQSCSNKLQERRKNLTPDKQIPKSLVESQKCIFGWIPLQENASEYGLNCFWPIILSYLQIQYYNIHFNKILATHRPAQYQSDQKQQQRSQDALSVGSSINIRQRKVSFGIINYKNEQNSKKKPKKPQNLWMIVNQNDQNKLIQLADTEKLINQLIKKIKLLAYEYAFKKDQAELHKKPITSVLLLKAFEHVFPKQQKQLADIFMYQKNSVNSILQFFTSSKNIHSKRSEHIPKSMEVLFEALKSMTINKFLAEIQHSENHEKQKESQFLNNMVALLKIFGFEDGKDFKLINSKKEINPESSNLLNLRSQNSQSKHKSVQNLTGLQFQNGFFRIFFTENGYLTSIDLESLSNVSEHVKKHFQKPFEPERIKEQSEQASKTEEKSSEGAVLTWKQTHFHRVTPSNFISRYNNRYFKNQRLIYKQKSKLQSRFKQQQVEDLIPQQNYECEYQILINSKHGKKENHCEGQTQDVLQLCSVPINPSLEHSFAQKKQPEILKMRQNYKEKFLLQNGRQFYVEQELVVYSHAGQDQGYILDDRQGYEKMRISREDEIERLYKREDFEISDNEILDDIERVLI